MGAKKTAAQIRRMQKRAAGRGEDYTPPPPANPPLTAENDTTEAPETPNALQELRAATKADVSSMNAKERRHHKRKLAKLAEAAGVEDLDTFIEAGRDGDDGPEEEDADGSSSGRGRKRARRLDGKPPEINNPYIIFVGQISYSTTSQAIFDHFQKELGEDVITPASAKVRLLTDSKTKKSRGMAFVELDDPKVMYDCLKLHRTHLNGRRINVERSAGGGKNSERRKLKIQNQREQQEKMMSNTVDNILEEYRSKGDLQEGELDDGVVGLFKRHSAHVVDAAIQEYLEADGKDKKKS
mmetsp:Transcript_36784/g.85918  ORF Transcript_36784/g.85918 Transcript_36784/m.85918 type:complete len:297 (-) Transcript_36784:180-1070(-)